MNKLSSIVRNIFTFELFFILFLFAGRYKADPRFSWVPIDLTLLFFVVGVACGVYILFKRGLSFRPSVLKLNAIYLVFTIYAFATLIWTPGEIYAKEKTLFIATLTFWPLLATSMIISSDYQRIKRFFTLLVLFGSWIALETFIAYMQGGDGWKVAAMGSNYLGIGRVLGPAGIVVLMYILFYTKSMPVRVAGIAVFCSFLYAQLITGGRGPLLAVIVPILIPLVAGIKLNNKQRALNIKESLPLLLSLIGVAIAAMIYMMNSENAPATLRRLNELVSTSGGGSSAQTRFSYYATSLSLWVYQPLWGYGVGSWPVIVQFMDYQYYPHNIILETMFEFGLVGLILLGTLTVYAFRQLGSWRSIRNNPLKLVILMIFVNTFLNASLSGDIPGNRFMFGALGLMMLDKNVSIASQFERSTKFKR